MVCTRQALPQDRGNHIMQFKREGPHHMEPKVLEVITLKKWGDTIKDALLYAFPENVTRAEN